MGDLRVLFVILRGAHVTEVYSLKRVVEVYCKHQLVKGDSFNLRTGFDLSDPRVQSAVLVILSPLCTKFSTLQELNIAVHGPEREAAIKIEKLTAVKHIEFSMGLAKLQMSHGAYFLCRHPARASSWELPAIIEVEKSEEVDTVFGDQCMYGLTTPNAD